jgi:aldose 1-epimerase
MTCPPNAFVTGESLITLQPGESHTTRYIIKSR